MPASETLPSTLATAAIASTMQASQATSLQLRLWKRLLPASSERCDGHRRQASVSSISRVKASRSTRCKGGLPTSTDTTTLRK